MFGKMLSRVTSLAGSGFDFYLSRLQSAGVPVGPTESEARKDYMEMLRVQSGLPW